jgi:hypothetical protein
MVEKIQIIKANNVEELTPEEYSIAIEAVNAFREDKAKQIETHQMSPEDAEKAKGSGKVHGDPFVVI